MMGKAPALNSINSNTDKPRKVNLTWLLVQEKSLNFKAKSSKGATSRNENKIVIPVRTDAVNVIALIESGKKTNAVRNKAFAGVGTPINESVWRVSTLNLANLSAEKMAIIIAT